MYPASEAFHRAAQAENPQKILLIFKDCVFTNDDVNVENGVEFDDNFNMEEDLAIGQALSNELRFSLFNDERLLNDYTFGEFTATLGVLISESDYVQRGTVTVVTGTATYTTQNSAPFLYRNGVAVSAQPAKAIRSILAHGGKLYCFCDKNTAVVYNEEDMSVDTTGVMKFMREKAELYWKDKGFHYSAKNRILKEWDGGVLRTWEFVPLGVFIADRPNAPDVIEADFTCHDLMQKFDKDMPSAGTLKITYPTTISNLFVKLCNYAKVPYKTASFINSGAVITEEPEDFKSATMRTVIGWIAEAAASNARFDRDGYLVFDWVRDTDQNYNENDYSDFQPYWYETQTVTKLYNRATDGSADKTSGSGDVGYLIQDNPLLRGVS